MRIKKIAVKNYRQFINSTINFEEDITVLAGANNSGKTSLIELFKEVFSNRNSKIGQDDIPIKTLEKLQNNIYSIFENKIFSKEKHEVYNEDTNKIKEDLINEIIELIGDETKDNLISVQIEVSYEKHEDISKFADYLMDLDSSKTSFYFIYKLKLNQTKMDKSINNYFDENQVKLEEKNEEKLKEKLVEIFVKSLDKKYYYTDSSYDTLQNMDSSEFKKLFNFKYLNANRNLDDEKVDKKCILSKGMIEFISDDEDGNELIKDLPNELKKPIEQSGIKEEIQDQSLEYLSKKISDISQTNGGRKEEIMLDIDIEIKAIKSLLKNVTKAKYKVDGEVNEYYLNESAQGLGYSNMIYIHLQVEKFMREFDKSIVNLCIIEEPEAHMHPQMQQVFIDYLFKSYENKNIQGLVTSHSCELVKETELKKIRVIREINLFENTIYDMNVFLNDDSIDDDLKKFYNLLFNINFSNIIFSDKIIMYEGDTERMFLQKVLEELDKFEDLNKQYIAYVQVGGAYAHKYKELVEYLGIKTLIITDIDYGKTCFLKDDVLEDKTTNSAIKDFYSEETGKEEYKIKDIFEWKEKRNDNLKKEEGLIRIEFQGEEDFYSRTLEEAMLSKYFEVDIEEKKSREYWEEKRDESKLKFSIPREDNVKVRDIVNSTSNSKTDFMYSVIINKLAEEMLPNYIEEGLKWLQD